MTSPPEPPLFERLAPPPGGREALRDRLAARERRRRLVGQGIGVAVAVAGVALLVTGGQLLLRPRPAPPVLPDDPVLAALAGVAGLPPVAVPAAARATTAVSAVPVGDPDVVYYRVVSLAAPRSAPRNRSGAGSTSSW